MKRTFIVFSLIITILMISACSGNSDWKPSTDDPGPGSGKLQSGKAFSVMTVSDGNTYSYVSDSIKITKPADNTGASIAFAVDGMTYSQPTHIISATTSSVMVAEYNNIDNGFTIPYSSDGTVTLKTEMQVNKTTGEVKVRISSGNQSAVKVMTTSAAAGKKVLLGLRSIPSAAFISAEDSGRSLRTVQGTPVIK